MIQYLSEEIPLLLISVFKIEYYIKDFASSRFDRLQGLMVFKV